MKSFTKKAHWVTTESFCIYGENGQIVQVLFDQKDSKKTVPQTRIRFQFDAKHILTMLKKEQKHLLGKTYKNHFDVKEEFVEDFEDFLASKARQLFPFITATSFAVCWGIDSMGENIDTAISVVFPYCSSDCSLDNGYKYISEMYWKEHPENLSYFENLTPFWIDEETIDQIYLKIHLENENA